MINTGTVVLLITIVAAVFICLIIYGVSTIQTDKKIEPEAPPVERPEQPMVARTPEPQVLVRTDMEEHLDCHQTWHYLWSSRTHQERVDGIGNWSFFAAKCGFDVLITLWNGTGGCANYSPKAINRLVLQIQTFEQARKALELCKESKYVRPVYEKYVKLAHKSEHFNQMPYIQGLYGDILESAMNAKWKEISKVEVATVLTISDARHVWKNVHKSETEAALAKWNMLCENEIKNTNDVEELRRILHASPEKSTAADLAFKKIDQICLALLEKVTSLEELNVARSSAPYGAPSRSGHVIKEKWNEFALVGVESAETLLEIKAAYENCPYNSPAQAKAVEKWVHVVQTKEEVEEAWHLLHLHNLADRKEEFKGILAQKRLKFV